MSITYLINIVKNYFPMEHHQNGFEHGYVLQNIPNHILIRDVAQHIHV